MSTADLPEDSNLYYTDDRVRDAISVSGSLSYVSGTGVISFTERTDAQVNSLADARVATATGANLDLSNKTTTNLAEGTNLYYTDDRVETLSLFLVLFLCLWYRRTFTERTTPSQ